MKMGNVEEQKEERAKVLYEREKIELALNLLNQLTISGIHNAQIVAQIGVILNDPVTK